MHLRAFHAHFLKGIQIFNMQSQVKTKEYEQQFLSFLMMVTLFCAFLMIWAAQANAQTSNSRSLILSDSYTEHYISPYLIKYADPNNNFGVVDVINAIDMTAEISQSTGSITSLNTDGNTTWLVFNIMNRASETQWVIDFGSSFAGRFGLFNNLKSYTYDRANNKVIENNVENKRNIILDLPVNERSQVILQIQSSMGVPVTIPARIVKKDNFLVKPNDSFFDVSTILLIGMAFFFAAIAFVRSHAGYCYFSLYYILLFGLLLIQNSYVFVSLPILAGAVIPLLYLVISITGLFIARLFWNMDDNPRALNATAILLIIICSVSFIAGLVAPIESPATKYGLLFGPSLLILSIICLVSIIQTQHGKSELTAFMFGWFILLFGVCITILSLSNIMQPVSTAVNALWFSLIPQAFFFIYAAKLKVGNDGLDSTSSKMLEINESATISKLRQSKENTEQDRLLKVIEQERKVLGELRKSEAKQTEEMRTAKDMADAANKAKSAFLAVVSHEIRTPMTGIMGMVRLLMGSNLTKEQKEYAQTIQDSSDAMLALLNDILDFEKIEQGKMVFENISFDLHRLVQGVATLMNGHAAQKDIELKIKIGDKLPRYVRGDPTRLRQVLLNLTGNAVKFTSEGEVTITAEFMGDGKTPEQCEIYFGVTDSGIGISKEAQKNLFSPFSQADNSISRKFGGTGLGLAISKGLVHGMGSAININSNEGEGSTFFFTLNMTKGQGNTQIADANTTEIVKKSLKILVVDDNAINQKVIQGFLGKSEHSLDFANTAEESLEKINANDYGLVLMDIELPQMNGDEATRVIRQSDKNSIKTLPVIALTGNVMPDDIERFYASGMNAVLAKPIDPEALEKTILDATQNIFKNPSMAVRDIKAEETHQEDVTPKPKKKKIKFGTSTLEVKQNVQSDAPKKSIEPSKPSTDIFNPETLQTLKGHISDKDIQDMLDDVVAKTQEIVEGMNAALAQEDMKTLSAKGHELKGMAGNFGLVEISAQAGEIETKAKTEALIVLSGLVNAMPEMQKRAKEALNHWISEDIN